MNGRDVMARSLRYRTAEVSVGLLLALVIALMILSLPTWPYAAPLGYGYYPTGGLGILLLIVIVLLLSRRRV